MTRTTTEPVAAAASVVVALEALGLAVLAGWQVVALVSGDVAEVVSAIALIALTAVGAIIVAAFAIALWRALSWGRSGAVVVQLLILAVAGGAVTGSYASPVVGAALAIPALLALALVIVAARKAAPRRIDDSADDAT